MRDDYDLALEGGVRGKYYDQYRAARGIELPDSPFIAKSTSAGARIGQITVPLSILMPAPTPPVQLGASNRAVEVSPRG
jgi:hypothetical protein